MARVVVLVRGRLASAASVLLAAQQAPPPAPPPAGQAARSPDAADHVPVEVNYVEVDAVVRDAQGNFVRDLQPGDFQVLEDGKPQTVTAFSLVDIPVERAERALFLPARIEPGRPGRMPRGPDGRLYVLLLDDIHTGVRRARRACGRPPSSSSSGTSARTTWRR